ncbi:glycosyltransferase family 1 protein [Phocaeicola sp.]|uniref:glycosyltransferase family 4 protein n=1 Tax=Phocaeicola sp. TaxID=2773926 RepID=UPI0023D369F6|nr:glycosyltransferase family 1 protein [Phocaeicola sp.]MDE5678595.1 glycosyltransferase family 4 protein [Phocaeicola sp.]
MKILYDYQAFDQEIGGISRYFVELVKHLNGKAECQFSTLLSNNVYLSQRDKISYKKMNSHVYNWGIKHINQMYSNIQIRRGDFDVFHATEYNDYFKKALNKPFVITIHDLIYERLLKNKYVLDRRKWQIVNADKIIVISDYTKKDLLYYYPMIDSNKVTVVHHGYTRHNCVFRKMDTKFILYVGGRSGYKNWKRFVIAVSKLLREDLSLNVICTGHPFTRLEQEFIDSLKISGQIKSVFVTDEQLLNLYYNALFFVYPSLIEGFGMPILEAFGCNCPVCLSSNSVFPEVAGAAAEYFDPYDVDSIRMSMLKLKENITLRDELAVKGEMKLREYSWEKTANQTLQIYKSLM